MQLIYFFIKLPFHNPILLALKLLEYGGFLILLIEFLKGLKDFWLILRQTKFASTLKYTTLKIEIPLQAEKNLEAIENIFTQISGAKKSFTLWEKWWHGMFNLKFSFEIVSQEGDINFYIRCENRYIPLIEQAIYSQYPDCEIKKLSDNEDYALKFKVEKFPDEKYDCAGTDFVLSKPFYIPIKTYKYMKDEITGEFKDPLESLFELMSSLKESEQLWFQITIVPISDDWREEGEKLIKKLLGIKLEEKFGVLQKAIYDIKEVFFEILKFPLGLTKEFYRQLITDSTKEIKSQFSGILKEVKSQIWRKVEIKPPSNQQTEPVKIEIPEIKIPETEKYSLIQELPESVLKIVSSIENKISKIGFLTKIRVTYLARKEVYDNLRVFAQIQGIIKQFSDLDLNSFSRGKYTKTGADYALAEKRKTWRKTKLLRRAKSRDWYAGDDYYILNTEELASLWHFPSKKTTKFISSIKSKTLEPEKDFRKKKILDYYEELKKYKGEVPEDLPIL